MRRGETVSISPIDYDKRGWFARMFGPPFYPTMPPVNGAEALYAVSVENRERNEPVRRCRIRHVHFPRKERTKAER